MNEEIKQKMREAYKRGVKEMREKDTYKVSVERKSEKEKDENYVRNYWQEVYEKYNDKKNLDINELKMLKTAKEKLGL